MNILAHYLSGNRMCSKMVVPGAILVTGLDTQTASWNLPEPSYVVLHFVNAAARQGLSKPGLPTHREVSIYRGMSAEDARYQRAQQGRRRRRAAEVHRLNEEAARAEWEKWDDDGGAARLRQTLVRGRGLVQ